VVGDGVTADSAAPGAGRSPAMAQAPRCAVPQRGIVRPQRLAAAPLAVQAAARGRIRRWRSRSSPPAIAGAWAGPGWRWLSRACLPWRPGQAPGRLPGGEPRDRSSRVRPVASAASRSHRAGLGRHGRRDSGVRQACAAQDQRRVGRRTCDGDRPKQRRKSALNWLMWR
jgi:hypothetical protein